MLLGEKDYAGIITSMKNHYEIRGSYLYERHTFTHYKNVGSSNITGYSDTRLIFSDDASIIYYKIKVRSTDNNVVSSNIEVRKFGNKLHFYIYSEMEKPFKPKSKITTDVELIIYDNGLRNLAELIKNRKLYFIENSNYPVEKYMATFQLPIINLDVDLIKSKNYTPGELPKEFIVVKDYIKICNLNSIMIKTSLEPKVGYFFIIKGKEYDYSY
ncbi:hypothetical protein D1867_06515 [Acidianus infernus]|uniref:Uncharacterized protein n=1 Tax=Acidianus infernus TaxID=12915 RepID=A0A6A9QGJ5_ACIIN|nr:hypothetical protein [Acidianus infernus]MUM64903.1 hypothetical protein [Acidianus infernus]